MAFDNSLSSPVGSSVKDGLNSHLCSLTYASVDNAVRCIAKLGSETIDNRGEEGLETPHNTV